jgi:holo-[acyl-carrier protein] synthase
MIVGIGVDTVEIARLTTWVQWSQKQLHRIFTPDEIAYSFQTPAKTVERLAVRFAAKEAFYKAYCASIFPAKPVPFLTLCKAVGVYNTPAPKLQISHDLLRQPLSVLEHAIIHLTCTHTTHTATALIIIEKI